LREGATGLSSRMGAMLPFLLARPGGGGFMANSCAPGIGGGRKEEEGDGKGDDEGGVSKQSDDTGRKLCCAAK